MRLLLINPRFPESFWSYEWAEQILPGQRAINPPLGLATLAALCPPHWQIEIVDENVEPIPLARGRHRRRLRHGRPVSSARRSCSPTTATAGTTS